MSWMRAVARRARLRGSIPDSFWREVIIARNLPFDEITYHPDGSIVIEPVGLTLPRHPVAKDLLWYYDLLNQILLNTDATALWNNETEQLDFRSGNETYPVECSEEVYTLHELLVLGVYNLVFQSGTLLVDIGAHVGYTSIFLAAQNPDLVIVGYEPLQKSCTTARRNIALNAHLSNRIVFNDYGLSDKSEQQTIQSEIAHRTRSSTVIDRASKPYSKVEYLPIKVRRASEVISNISSANPDRDVWIKMDCEGCEYAVIEDLRESGVIEQVSGLLFEWHKIESDIDKTGWLSDALTACGFCVYMPGAGDKSAELGLCLATRR